MRFPFLSVWVGLALTACAPQPWRVASIQPGTATTAAQPVTAAAPTDSAAEQYIRPFRQRVVREMSERIATSAQPWLKPGKLGNNAPLTTWVAGVLRVEAGRALGVAPDFAALTNGSIRAGLPQGPITVGNVFEIMPFENELTVVPVPGTVVRQLCDYAGKFDNFAAVNLTWQNDVVTKRAFNIQIGGQPLDTTRTYTLAINDYLANGGDGMSFLRPLRQTPANRTIRQAILDYLRREKVVQPLP